MSTAFSRTPARVINTQHLDPKIVADRALEQIGSTAAIQAADGSFAVDLPTGGSEGTLDPLPDIGEE